MPQRRAHTDQTRSATTTGLSQDRSWPDPTAKIIGITQQRSSDGSLETPGKACRCGHGVVMHRHHRAGSDCSCCDCPRYRGESLAAALINALRNPRD